jgi:hypothetical protein
MLESNSPEPSGAINTEWAIQTGCLFLFSHSVELLNSKKTQNGINNNPSTSLNRLSQIQILLIFCANVVDSNHRQ